MKEEEKDSAEVDVLCEDEEMDMERDEEVDRGEREIDSDVKGVEKRVNALCQALKM